MKVKGITVGTTMPRADWNQNDPLKADFIKNKPDLELMRGFDSGELTSDTKQYRFNEGDAQFVMITVRSSDQQGCESYTAVLDCLTMKDGEGIGYPMPSILNSGALGKALTILKKDGVFIVTLYGTDTTAYIHRVCGYRYGSSGSGGGGGSQIQIITWEEGD